MAHQKKDGKLLFVVISVVIALAAIIALRFYTSNVTPRLSVPARKMPSPNAYDYSVAASKAIVDANSISNAAYENPKGKQTLTEWKQILDDNAEAFKTLRKGFSFEYRQPMQTWTVGTWPPFPKFRNMGRLLKLDGRLKAALGDWKGSMDSYLDVVEFSIDIHKGGNDFSLLVGTSIRSLVAQDIWDSAKKLNRAEAKAAARRLEKLMAGKPDFTEVLENCSLSTQVEMMPILESSDWRKYVPMIALNDRTDWKDRARLLTCTKSQVLNNYKNFMDQYIDSVSKGSYTAHIKVTPNYPYGKEMVDLYDRIWFDYTYKTEARNALLLVSLALQAYHSDHGNYPSRLQDLVPAYLSTIPKDPFNTKRPLIYKKTAKGYLLYSVGPDGVDNGGNPVCDSRYKMPQDRYLIHQDSKGDMVAGINR
ncbi:MAG: hypothetical protein ABFD46_06110 [Armatimonadota bacterium]|nr:type II secretion system protein GspG [bacterium]